MQSRNSADKAGINTVRPLFRTPLTGIQLQGKIIYNHYRFAHISSLSTGVIGKVLVKIGQYVKKGQKLLELHSNRVVDSKEDYFNALTEERVSKLNYIREKKLRDKQISSGHEYEMALVQYRKSQQKSLSSRQKLINLGFSKIHLKKMELTQSPTPVLPITAPFDGTITSHYAVRGERKNIGEKLLTIVDLSELWIEIYIPEIFLNQVHIGSKLNVLPNTLTNLNLETELNWISSEIDPKTRTVKALANLKNFKKLLKHGMYAHVYLQPTHSQKVLTVPAESLHYFSKQPFLFVKLEKDLFEIRRVYIGSSQAEEVEILKGLNRDEWVVSERSFILKSEFLKSRLGAGCVDH